MNLKRLKQTVATWNATPASVAFCLHALDKSIPAFRTLFLIAGVIGAALDVDPMSDYLFAAGLLLHFTIWFETWWQTYSSR